MRGVASGMEDLGGDGGDFLLGGFDVAEPRRAAVVQPLAKRLGDFAAAFAR